MGEGKGLCLGEEWTRRRARHKKSEKNKKASQEGKSRGFIRRVRSFASWPIYNSPSPDKAREKARWSGGINKVILARTFKVECREGLRASNARSSPCPTKEKHQEKKGKNLIKGEKFLQRGEEGK